MELARITTIPSAAFNTPRARSFSPALSFLKPLSLSSSRFRATGVAPRRSRLITRCITRRVTQDDLQYFAERCDFTGVSIVLMGMDSFMKYNAGRVLADALEYCFMDSDHWVQKYYGGKEDARLAKVNDEEAYQAVETKILTELTAMTRLVINTGQGALSVNNLGLLRYVITIWVDVPIDIISSEYPETISNPQAIPEVVSNLAMTYLELKGACQTASAHVSLQKIAERIGFANELVRPEDMAMEMLVEINKITRARKALEAEYR